MASRREPSDSFDYFPTPPWATRALCEFLRDDWRLLPSHTVREPACGEGDMARPLAEYAARVIASDIQDLGHGEVEDYLFTPTQPVDWVITNPPFRLAQAFIEKALDEARVGVAMFARLAFIEGIERHDTLFGPRPPAFVMPFVERVPIVRGRLDAKASSATAYAWFVWLSDHRGYARLRHIPPCRRRLERPGDYPDAAMATPQDDAGLFA